MQFQQDKKTIKSKLKEKNIFSSEIFPVMFKKGKKKIIRSYKKRRTKTGENDIRRQRKTRMEKKVLFSFKKGRRFVEQTTIYIQSSHNNTIYTLAYGGGKTESSISAGMCGFQNTRKSTSYASQITAEKLPAKRRNQICVKMKGLGAGKLSGVRTLNRLGFRITKIEECTALPHNGCRPAKSRRL